MSANRTRRPLLKRACLWTCAVVLFLAGYVSSAPLSLLILDKHIPTAVPIAEIAYAPLAYWFDNESLPGSTSYRAYCQWCERVFDGRI